MITSMIKITTILQSTNSRVRYRDEIILPFESRQKSRFKATTSNQEEVGFFLERGHILRDEDRVSSEDGSIFKITAAKESVCTLFSKDALLLTKAAYHLGNRHIPLQVGASWIRFQADHVLQQMVEQMGLHAEIEDAPFEPESGAYFTGLTEQKKNSHSHSHKHSHNHNH